MVYEMAQIEVIRGKERDFEAGVSQALALFTRARGCRGVELHRQIEQPDRYILIVQWKTIEDHTVLFRESADFQEWRRLVGSFFVKPPIVEHFEVVLGPDR
ncbi:antibiotic biosynthesis monooxygenase family protein [Paraburkholderia largidicola]|uniref:Antibiotic biosynthesis monooxygenase n=1 Tax=Paraburkholderia largidicola TaxID=3014751 RepID=A0A7I8C2I6_9BURK|nr:antibiotic biosynthesis monooxygenase [Paraburkholderia sp. PGU16]BCF95053.1 antibiotic biosynthesis monooxygenase [Paraburkholderia sp. PGU16]